MEAATPLPQSRVRVLGDRLRVDGLVVGDQCAVRLVAERTEAGEDPAAVVTDAIEIGARVLDREQTGVQADFVKAEFERAARSVESSFADQAQRAAAELKAGLEAVFGPDSGHLTKALERHFSDDSSAAVQHRVRAVLTEVMAKSREDLLRQFSSSDGNNPLAGFQRAALHSIKTASDQQHAHLREMSGRIEALNAELAGLRAEKEKLEEVAAEAERGTAKGRSYEEEVAAAVDAIALPLGDDAQAVGDQRESTGKKGDVVVAIGAGHGPAQGRIVFEAKDRRLSRPGALQELDACMAERNADFAVLVVPTVDEMPAKMHPLREYNGDKLIVVYDLDDGPLALQVAYSLARARVLMARGEADGVDIAAVTDTAERAVAALDDVRRIRQQLTGAKTQIDKASDIVGAMSDRVRAHLQEIAALVREGSGVEDPPAAAGAAPPAAPAAPAAAARRPRPPEHPTLL
jgi:hypothetical protein